LPCLFSIIRLMVPSGSFCSLSGIINYQGKFLKETVSVNSATKKQNVLK